MLNKIYFLHKMSYFLSFIFVDKCWYWSFLLLKKELKGSIINDNNLYDILIGKKNKYKFKYFSIGYLINTARNCKNIKILKVENVKNINRTALCIYNENDIYEIKKYGKIINYHKKCHIFVIENGLVYDNELFRIKKVNNLNKICRFILTFNNYNTYMKQLGYLGGGGAGSNRTGRLRGAARRAGRFFSRLLGRRR